MGKRIVLVSWLILAAVFLCACGPCEVHEFEAWVIEQESTCTAAGKQVRYCTACDTVEEETVPVAAHDFGEWIVESAPDCTESGLQTRTCRNCGFMEKEDIAPTGHAFGEWVVVTDPTCVDSGLNSRSCGDCGLEESETIAALGHSYEAFICTVCQAGRYAFCETGTFYEGLDGLNVKIVSFQKNEYAGYYLYRLTYTLKNEVPDTATCEGIFRLHMADGSFEPQYGFFDDLFYKESRNFIYEWKILKNQEVVLLEYVPFDRAYEESILEDSLHWTVS